MSARLAAMVPLMTGRRVVRSAMALWFVLGSSIPALAAEKDFDIQTQDATAALAEFGRQAGTEILFEFDVIKGRRTHPLVGRFEPIEALRRMTAGTDLRVSQSPDGVLVVECECRTARENGASSGSLQTDGREAGRSAATLGSDAQVKASPSAPLELSPKRLQDVVITGSRIRQDPLSAPMPLLTVDRVQLEDSGSENLAEVISQYPSIGVGLGLSNSRQLIVGGGLSLISLRDLGTARTLVLVNGRRQVSGAPTTAAVDLNTIPTDLVDRVDVVTAGTSAVYGADAIGGVVNIILRRDFDGLKVRATSSITSRGDGATRGLSLTGGRNFEFRDHAGNATFNFSFDDDSGVPATSRDYASNGLDLISNPADTGPNDGIPNFIHAKNVTYDIVSTAGHFSVGGQTWIFSPDGRSIRPFDFGAIGDRFGRSIGGDGASAEVYDPLRLPIRREVFTGTLRYGEPEAEVFLETHIGATHVTSAFQPTFDVGDVQLKIDNPFLPADAVALMKANNVDSVPLQRILDEGGARGTENNRLMQQYVIGGNLTLPNSWRLEGYYSFGHTSEATLDTNDRNTARFRQALDAVRDPVTGQIVCRDPSNGCMPLDLVGIGQASTAALDFIRTSQPFDRSATQHVVSASLGGDLFALPAGRVQFAFGAEYRRESARSEPSAAIQSGATFLPQEEPAGGSFDVREGFIETLVPLLRSQRLVKELSLNGAVRLSDYNTSGHESAWHVGLEYAPVQALRFRGVLSRSVRAPNLNELFEPANRTYVFAQDPCDASVIHTSPRRMANCQALGVPDNFNAPTNDQTILAMLGGNPALVPEVGDTWTAGLVFRPQGAEHLSLASDYWHITIRQAINPIPPQTLIDGCVDSSLPVDANPQCAAVQRNPLSHAIIAIQTPEQNIARINAAGVDTQLTYRHEVPGGDLEASVVATWLRQLESLGDMFDPQSLTVFAGVVGDPKWRGLSRLTYRSGSWRVTWRTQFVGNALIAWSRGQPADQFDLPDTGTKLFHDLAINLQLGEHARVHFTVGNVLDTKPPARGYLIHSGIGLGAGGGVGGGATIYPNLGRTFFGSVEYQF